MDNKTVQMFSSKELAVVIFLFSFFAKFFCNCVKIVIPWKIKKRPCSCNDIRCSYRFVLLLLRLDFVLEIQTINLSYTAHTSEKISRNVIGELLRTTEKKAKVIL